MIILSVSYKNIFVGTYLLHRRSTVTTFHYSYFFRLFKMILYMLHLTIFFCRLCHFG
jgi:hypothetical protein